MTSPEQTAAMVVIVNTTLVGVGLVAGGWWLGHGALSVSQPGARQNIAESALSFFIDKARGVRPDSESDRLLGVITTFLFTLFAFIITANAVSIIPVPVLNRPPTSHYSATLALATASVLGTLAISVMALGLGPTLRHLVWPNPLQWVSEVTDVLSLSLRLFGNIAGEYMTIVLVTAAVPYGIPLILHALGMIPIVVQALVFTLLTTSFLATALHHDHGRSSSDEPQPTTTGEEAAK